MKHKKYINENKEIKYGFSISSNRKKVWNIQLGLLEELKRICQKHNIKYYADGGTLLGAIRHEGYIPRDDDIDIAMFRDDFEKFKKISKKELPKYIKIYNFYGGFVKLTDITTAALGENNRWDNDFIGGINIDIFCLDYASKYKIINWMKSKIINLLRILIITQKSYQTTYKMKKWKNTINITSNFIFKFCKVNCSRLQKYEENIRKKIFFKSKYIYSGYNPYRFFPANIYMKSHTGKFENTTINIPDGYETFLKILYGDYMKPSVIKGGHNCRYSVDKSYKDIIKTFDRNKTNEDNYSNCKLLFNL